MSDCVIPGSFDPITLGHLDLIRRTAALFGNVTVTVMVNKEKNGCIPYEDRVRLIRKACGDIPNVKADLWTGLLADYMRQRPDTVVIRGVRNAGEFEKEQTAAAVNRRLYPGMETLMMPASEGWNEVSSSAVREIASFGGNFRPFVPECIYPELEKWLKSPDKNG